MGQQDGKWKWVSKQMPTAAQLNPHKEGFRDAGQRGRKAEKCCRREVTYTAEDMIAGLDGGRVVGDGLEEGQWIRSEVERREDEEERGMMEGRYAGADGFAL